MPRSEVKSKATTAAVLAAFLLAGCASAATSQQSLQIACRAYSASLVSLAGYRAAGHLSESQIATVDQWRPTLNQACSGEAADASGLLDLVEAGVTSMILIERELRHEP